MGRLEWLLRATGARGWWACARRSGRGLWRLTWRIAEAAQELRGNKASGLGHLAIIGRVWGKRCKTCFLQLVVCWGVYVRVRARMHVCACACACLRVCA